MIERTIEDIAKFCNGEMNSRAEDMKTAIVKGVSIDTRTIEAGIYLFRFGVKMQMDTVLSKWLSRKAQTDTE